MRERCQHDAGDLGCHAFYVAGNGKGVVVGITRHTNHQINVRRLQYFVGLLRRRHLRERRRIAHAQLRVFVEQLLVDASVVLEHEGVVRVSHYEYMKDAFRHEVDEADIFKEEVVKLLWYIRVHNLLLRVQR